MSAGPNLFERPILFKINIHFNRRKSLAAMLNVLLIDKYSYNLNLNEKPLEINKSILIFANSVVLAVLFWKNKIAFSSISQCLFGSERSPCKTCFDQF